VLILILACRASEQGLILKTGRALLLASGATTGASQSQAHAKGAKGFGQNDRIERMTAAPHVSAKAAGGRGANRQNPQRG